jgi:phenylacetate-CoA ligase
VLANKHQPASHAGSPVSESGDLLYAWAYEHVLFPTWQRVVRSRAIFDQVAWLETSQWLPADRIERVQLASLRALLLHAASQVPYFRELFSRIGFDPRDVTERAHLAELPLLTRDIVRERYDDLVDPASRATNIHKGTGGTTGSPLRFEYCNQSESWRQAIKLRGYRWGGYRLGLPTLHYWAQGAAIPRGLRAAKVRLDRALRREVYVDAIGRTRRRCAKR